MKGCTFFILTAIVSIVSYDFIERKLFEFDKSKKIFNYEKYTTGDQDLMNLSPGDRYWVTWLGIEKEKPCGGSAMIWAVDESTNASFLTNRTDIKYGKFSGDATYFYNTQYLADGVIRDLPESCYQQRPTLRYVCADARAHDGSYLKVERLAGPRFCIK